jgi:hypothetical protein
MRGVRQSPSSATGALQRPQCHGLRAGRETAACCQSMIADATASSGSARSNVLLIIGSLRR